MIRALRHVPDDAVAALRLDMRNRLVDRSAGAALEQCRANEDSQSKHAEAGPSTDGRLPPRNRSGKCGHWHCYRTGFVATSLISLGANRSVKTGPKMDVRSTRTRITLRRS